MVVAINRSALRHRAGSERQSPARMPTQRDTIEAVMAKKNWV